MGRTIDFYKDINKFKNVKMVDNNFNPFKLIDNAEAVVTLTGTSGLEAILRGIPALVFGYAWYRTCPGVFYTTTTSECTDALRKIDDGFKVNSKEVEGYLLGLEKKCVRGYADPLEKGSIQTTYEEHVNEAKENCLLRLVISPSPRDITFPEEYNFTFGRGTLLKDGTNAVIFSYGPVMLHEALLANEILKEKKFSLKVINMPWLNRVAQNWLEDIVENCKTIFVLDNHMMIGGLGDFLLNILIQSEKLKQKGFYKFAVEEYPVCGTPQEALKYHGLNGESLAKKILQEAKL